VKHSRRWAFAIVGIAAAGCATGSARVSSTAPALAAPKPRVVVTTDPELDDSNSLVRYLLFSTDFRTEGIIYASSGFHWKGDGTGKKWFVANREYTRFGLNLCPCESWRWSPDEHFIDDAVATYEKVYPNLRVHDTSYPTPTELKSKIRWGNVEFDGDISKDSPGSNLIKALLLDDQPGPIYLLAWGGLSTISRALKSIQDQYASTPQWLAIYQKVSRKAILSPSGDQDDTYATYIHPNWPEIKSLPVGVGGVPLAYAASITSSAENAIYYSSSWTRENISSRGALGAFYRVWGDGKQMVKGDIFDFFGLSGYTVPQLRSMGYIVWTPPRPRGEFIAEGDTFTYLNLLNNGLAGYDSETPGGWAGHAPKANRGTAGGGVAQSSATMTFEDFLRSVELAAARGDAARPPSPNPNFTPAAQNALAARMKWSVTPTYAGANHEPAVSIRGSARISAEPGELVRLDGLASDPDGNSFTVKWWRWKNVDSYPGEVTLSSPTSLVTTMRIPADAAAGQTIQLVLEVTDTGEPPLTRYQRVVVVVRP